MRPIDYPGLRFSGASWVADCRCGSQLSFSTKGSAAKMLLRGSCRNCRRDYRTTRDAEFSIYRRADGRWCSRCSGCGNEQAYTRRDHAKQSSLSDWQCKTCVARSKGFSANRPVGDKVRHYNRFFKSAQKRGIKWDISLEQMYAVYTGRCALTGWELSISYKETTASLDRIDSTMGYVPGNIQWVHVMVNMCKNKYPEKDFVAMCQAVAAMATPRKGSLQLAIC